MIRTRFILRIAALALSAAAAGCSAESLRLPEVTEVTVRAVPDVAGTAVRETCETAACAERGGTGGKNGYAGKAGGGVGGGADNDRNARNGGRDAEDDGDVKNDGRAGMGAAEYAGSGSVRAEAFPSRMVAEMEVRNDGPVLKLRGGRIRLSCGGARAAMITLDGTVRIPARGVWRVAVPLRINMARNSAALALRSAVARRDASAVTAEWEVSARRGMVRIKAEGGPAGLDSLSGGGAAAMLWDALDALAE